MNATLRQDDPLRAFLSGKRSAPRLEVEVPVVVRGKSTEILGTTIDLSEGGVLVCVATSQIGADAENQLGYLRFVDAQWGEGFDVVFSDAAVVAEATLVRLAPREDDEVLFLGCRFVHELSPTQQQKLGLLDEQEAAEVESESAPTSLLPFVAGKTPVSVLLYTQPDAGPRFIGQVVSAGGNALAVVIEAVDLKEARKALTGTLAVDVRVGTNLLWTTEVHLAGVRFLDRPGGGVEVALLGSTKMPRKLRKALVKRGS